MSPFDYIKNASHLHHAYVIEGAVLETLPLLRRALQARGVNVSGNPDVFIGEYDRLLVEHARTLIAYASLAPLAERKYALITFAGATEEAQSALLKAVEEASGNTTFFFLTERGTPLLPTLLSRTATLCVGTTEEGGDNEDFLNLSPKERLALVENLAKNQDREGARRIVQGLLMRHSERPYSKEVLRDLLDAHAFLGLSGSSIKTALGHVALVVQK